MKELLVKVCGMRQAENIREVEALGVAWMGFIFYPRSPRFVGEEPPGYLPQQAKRVGVFVDAALDEVKKRAERFQLDYLQLHGNESPDYCRTLRHEEYQLIKAFSIATPADVAATADYEGLCSFFLFDTQCTGYGGSGKRFDWSLLQHYQGNTPFLLSGGIGEEQLEELRSLQHPHWAGVDLNSRFEQSPGVKETERLKRFIEQLKKE